MRGVIPSKIVFVLCVWLQIYAGDRVHRKSAVAALLLLVLLVLQAAVDSKDLKCFMIMFCTDDNYCGFMYFSYLLNK